MGILAIEADIRNFRGKIAVMEIAVSSDRLGLGQNIDLLKDIYEEIWGTVRGVEVLAITPSPTVLQNRVKAVEDMGLKVSTIHGRVGSFGKTEVDTMKLWLIQSQMLETPWLMRTFQNRSQNLLFHTPEFAENPGLLNLALQYNATVVIENHPEVEGITNMLEMVGRLRESGVNSWGMVDIAHQLYLEGYTGDWNINPKTWDSNLRAISNALNARTEMSDGTSMPVVKGIHFPIGTLPDDSLPIMRMSDDMLKELIEVINSALGLEWLVFENQGTNLLSTIMPLNVQNERNRLHDTFDRLAKNGFRLTAD